MLYVLISVCGESKEADTDGPENRASVGGHDTSCSHEPRVVVGARQETCQDRPQESGQYKGGFIQLLDFSDTKITSNMAH